MKRVENCFWAVVCVMGLCCAAWAQQKADPQQAPKAPPAVAAAPDTASSEPTAASQGLSALAQGVPRLVKFSGTVKDPLGKARTGTVGITFAMYRDQEGGAALWLETQNVELDEQGHYTVLLGATKNEGLPVELFQAAEPRWLGWQVQLPREVERPRVLLVSVPYALKAAEAETLGGQPLSSFVLTTSQGSTPTAQKGPASTTVGPATAGTGTTDFVAKWLDNLGTLGNSSIFDNGLVGIGTTNPQATLDVQLTTGAATNALNSTITLNNTSPITGSVLSAFKMTLLDASQAANLSKQPARFVYLRDASATGGVTAFDSVMTATSFLSANAPYQLRGINIEGPTMATGTTLGNFTGLYIGSPGGAGTVTNKFALVTERNAGNVGFGTTGPSQRLEVAGGNLKISGAGNALIFPDGSVLSSAATGIGGGTITGVMAGAGLSGGGTAGGVTLSVPNGGITNSMLAANSVTNANIADGSLSPTKITGTAATLGANSFIGNQTIAGNVGIGTTTPILNLDVNGSTAMFALPDSTGGAGSFALLATGGLETGTPVSGSSAFGGTGVDAFGGNATGGGVNFGGVGVKAMGGNETSATVPSSGGDGVVATGGNGVSGGNGIVAIGGNGATGNLGGDGINAFVGSPAPRGTFAGFFSGDVDITGTLTSGVKDFKIDHPLDPASKYLVHASVESSEMMNIYTGNVTLDGNGAATVQLPDWFQAENADFRYSLTAIGASAPGLYIAQEVANNSFQIAGGRPGLRVSWQITGIRQDAFAKAHPLQVEAQKTERERGFYIHPELFGAPEEKNVEWARHPQVMKRIKEMRQKQTQPNPAR